MYESDTIAAIATAMSNAGIGIIRISGPEAVDIADRIFRGKHSLKEAKTHTIHYGHIVWDDQVIDEVMVMVMLAPRSYTTEDTIEIDCHGGILVEKKILGALLAAGARMAEPGEYTKRAFLHGRIDLSQAESVMDVIQSENTNALTSSMNQLHGALSRVVKDIRGKLLYELAYIESALDDPEHYDLTGYPAELAEKLSPLTEQLEHLSATADDGAKIREGIRTAIVGKPNAGKSSLLNALAKKDRAIVTDIPGTTRDILEEQVNLGDITLQLVDTAGIRHSEDVVEQIGVQKALESMEDCDLVIYVVDGSTPLDENDRRIQKALEGRKCITLLNKSDLPQVITEETLKESGLSPVIRVSAKEEMGIDELTKIMTDMFFHGKISVNEQVYITNMRHKAAIDAALASLRLVQGSIDAGMPEDFLSIDLMDAYEALGRITGETVEDDLANEIFSKFCMGK